jgi:hypothetical protein
MSTARLAVLAAVVLLAGAAFLACGARTDPGALPSTGLDGGTGAPADGHAPDALDPCADGAPPPVVYALDGDGILYRYDPVTGQSTALGTPNCGNPNIAWTVTASVDHAFIVFTDWTLDVVDLTTLACTGTPFDASQVGLEDEFGVAAMGSGANERIYVYGVPGDGAGPVLAVADTQSYALQVVGRVLPAPGTGGTVVNLTASSDGTLYAFSPLGLVLQINATNAAVLQSVDTGVTTDGTWATIAYGSHLFLWVDSDVVGYDLATHTRTGGIDAGVSAIGASAVGGCVGP